ncbi:MAG: DUF6496 domain-containing protein [Pseudobdellovibrionaceae bacterium]
MPQRRTIKRARKAARQGKSASTQAGEFVHDQIKKIRRGKHGARSAKQAIAIGLSEARRAGVKVKSALGVKRKSATAKRTLKKASPKRSRAVLKALKREPRSSVSRRALSRQAKQAAAHRSPAQRQAAARRAAHTREIHAR